MFPKGRPRHKDEEQADLKAEENEGYGKKTIHHGLAIRGQASKSRNSKLGDLDVRPELPFFLLRLDFLDAGRLAAEFAHVIKLRATHASRADYFNLIDHLGVQRENALNAMSK